jgi:hypothetical protein
MTCEFEETKRGMVPSRTGRRSTYHIVDERSRNVIDA